ncbi:MAG: hypothetical protein M5U28_09500 [Sandaracinaceae bacterium]|nr:hypothetical protein [Sandaracinaceae bacterium]
MDVLVTSSRLPFALEMIRKLGRRGHLVYAADTFRSAPGSHSRHVVESFVVGSPRYDTRRFVADLEAILRGRHVDCVVPAFEEVFYLAKHRARLERHARVFAPSFETLRRLHDKLRFLELAAELGLSVPRTIVARDRRELAHAAREARPLLRAPRLHARRRHALHEHRAAGRARHARGMRADAREPLPRPALRRGDRRLHVRHRAPRARRRPRELRAPADARARGGIVFESVEDAGALAIAQRVAEATRYHGQLSIDLIRTREGLVVVECNPRASAGLVVMPDSMFDEALRDRPPRQTRVAPAGARRKLSLALIRNAIVRRGEARRNLAALVRRGADVYADPHDLRPLLFQLVAYARVLGYRARRRRVHRTDLMQGYFHDLLWDGEDIAA